MSNILIIKTLGQVPYLPTMQAMAQFTQERQADTPDELWLCEHPAVFTQGVAGKAGHVLLNPEGPGHIPVVPTSRGGQVTFHGPGQVVAYPLVNLKQRGYYVKEYVYRLEEALIRTLAHWGITGHRVVGAPGIYVRLADPFGHAALKLPHGPQPDPQERFEGLGKIAALGIKVTRHCTWHGLALNVAMDLSPFARINPCGYAGLQTVDMVSLGAQAPWPEVAAKLAQQLERWLAP